MKSSEKPVDLRSPEAQKEIVEISDWVSEHLVKRALAKGWRTDRVIAGLVMGAVIGFRKATTPREGRKTFLSLAGLMWDLVTAAHASEPS